MYTLEVVAILCTTQRWLALSTQMQIEIVGEDLLEIIADFPRIKTKITYYTYRQPGLTLQT